LTALARSLAWPLDKLRVRATLGARPQKRASNAYRQAQLLDAAKRLRSLSVDVLYDAGEHLAPPAVDTDDVGSRPHTFAAMLCEPR